MDTVIGIFTDKADVEDAVERLQDEGFDPKDVSIVMKNPEESEEVSHATGANVASGAVSGVVTGAVIGGIVGVLATSLIPGLGALFVAGPIAASLGLGGAAATTTAGIITGAAAGGLIGILTNMGVSHKDAQRYEDKIKEGAILVMVPTVSHSEDVEAVFDEYNAEDVKTVHTENQQVTKDEDYPRHYAFAKGGRSTHKKKRK